VVLQPLGRSRTQCASRTAFPGTRTCINPSIDCKLCVRPRRHVNCTRACTKDDDDDDSIGNVLSQSSSQRRRYIRFFCSRVYARPRCTSARDRRDSHRTRFSGVLLSATQRSRVSTEYAGPSVQPSRRESSVFEKRN
jgi:hypothetical protein